MLNSKKNKPKILFCIDNLSAGGRERRLLELIKYLIKQNLYKISLVLIDDNIHYKYVYDYDIPVIVLGRKYFNKDPFVFIKFLKYCNAFKPDIIHSWGYMANMYSIPAKIICKIPLISSMITSANRISRFGFWINFVFADFVFSNSKAGLVVNCVDRYKKVGVIYNGVSDDRFTGLDKASKKKKELGCTGKKIIIMCASFTVKKDYDLYLNVANIITSKRDDIIFLALGDGPDYNRIKTRIELEGIKNIICLGNISDVEEYVAISDIGILLSNINYHAEGISNSIMEYMALGKPVIATNNGGTVELVENNKTGFLIDKNNIDDICKKILFLVDNKNVSELMGEKGKDIINNKFTSRKMAESYTIVYEEIFAMKLKNKK